MTDNKENRKSFEEFIAETVERQYSMDAPKTITPQELEERLQKRKAQRRMRRLKTVGFAAIFVIAVICTSIGFNTLTTNVGADKNDKEEIRTENGVVIEDGGYGGSSEDKVVITEWDDVEAIALINEDMAVINYIPQEYRFEQLLIEEIEPGSVLYEYRFKKQGSMDIIEIEQYIQNEGEIYFGIDNVDRVIKSLKGDIYIQDGDIKRAIMQIDDGALIKIWSSVSDEELVRILDSIEY